MQTFSQKEQLLFYIFIMHKYLNGNWEMYLPIITVFLTHLTYVLFSDTKHKESKHVGVVDILSHCGITARYWNSRKIRNCFTYLLINDIFEKSILLSWESMCDVGTLSILFSIIVHIKSETNTSFNTLVEKMAF